MVAPDRVTAATAVPYDAVRESVPQGGTRQFHSVARASRREGSARRLAWDGSASW